MQTLRVRHELLCLAVGPDGEAALAQLEENALFRFGKSTAMRELANDLVISFLMIRPELFAQSIRFGLKIAKLNPGRRCQRSNRTAASIAIVVALIFHSNRRSTGRLNRQQGNESRKQERRKV